MVSLLLKKGASATQSAGGYDALMHAARGGNSECVDLILATGVKVMNESKEGLTARDYAVQAGHTDIAVKLDKLMQAEIERIKASRKK
jgi:ankyrin repeat protein